MHVREILRDKGSEVVTIPCHATVVELVRLLSARKIGAAVVLEAEAIAGIASERDVVRALAARGDAALGAAVSEIMSREVVTCAPEDTIHGIMAIMTSRRIRHVPVLEGGRLAGLVSIGDVVKHRLGEIEAEAHLLRDYVTAR